METGQNAAVPGGDITGTSSGHHRGHHRDITGDTTRTPPGHHRDPQPRDPRPAGVKPMDKEGEKDHTPAKNEGSGMGDCLPGLEKKEKETKGIIKTIQWVTGNDFTVERGQEQIEELISTWDIHERWLHHVEFLEEEELKDSTRYHYRACWGIPTRRKPIPRATASVYFVMVISKLKPDTSPVEVFFRLEASRLIRRPEEFQFREKWLEDIIENKIILIERLRSQ